MLSPLPLSKPPIYSVHFRILPSQQGLSHQSHKKRNLAVEKTAICRLMRKPIRCLIASNRFFLILFFLISEFFRIESSSLSINLPHRIALIPNFSKILKLLLVDFWPCDTVAIGPSSSKISLAFGRGR